MTRQRPQQRTLMQMRVICNIIRCLSWGKASKPRITTAASAVLRRSSRRQHGSVSPLVEPVGSAQNHQDIDGDRALGVDDDRIEVEFGQSRLLLPSQATDRH